MMSDNNGDDEEEGAEHARKLTCLALAFGPIFGRPQEIRGYSIHRVFIRVHTKCGYVLERFHVATVRNRRIKPLVLHELRVYAFLSSDFGSDFIPALHRAIEERKATLGVKDSHENINQVFSSIDMTII
jgi:hypothetical protein